MRLNFKTMIAAAGLMAVSWSSAHALEAGALPQSKAGVLIGLVGAVITVIASSGR